MAHEKRLRGLGLVLTCGALGCVASQSCSPRASDSNRVDRPNVLLIAIDTLRADKLGCYGGTRGLSPNIDRLASEGVRFEHAFSHAPWTLPAFASLFSSLLPPEHGAGGSVVDHFRALPQCVETMAEHLASAGFSTAAVVNVDFLSKTFGLMQGFQHVDEHFSENNREMRNAGETTRAALRWLDDRTDKPFFLFVHYFDPHAEYAPPQPFRRRFAKPQDAETDGFVFGSREQVVGLRRGQFSFRPQDIERAEALYDGEIAYTDAEVGELLDGLRARGLDASTLVILTADHGEEFLDHGSYEHGHSLYDELIHVPLIFRLGSRMKPGTISNSVGHVDVAPTLCSIVGIEPARSFRGRDLSPLLRGSEIPPSSLVARGNFWGEALSSLRAGDYQLIHTPAHGATPDRVELFRWNQDVKEAHDLSSADPDRTRTLQLELEGELTHAAGRACEPAPNARLSPAELERLHGLGYPQSGGESNDPSSPPK